MEALCSEVEKIVNASYPTSLANLNNILHNTSQDVIEEWSYEHEHQLESLAASLAHNPSLSHYGISVVERLASHSTSFRDALLRRAPSFLHDLLEKTNTSNTDLDAVVGACVAMLSAELPPEIALPAAAETLIQQLFRKTMIEVTVESVRPIHSMLSGGCRSLLGILPSSTIANFRIQLVQVMRKTTASQDAQLLSSYCLAILAKLRESGTNVTSLDDSVESSKFFSNDRALKTVHLLVLQVIYACKTEAKDSRNATLAQINLAREVVLAVDAEIREKWAKQNPQIIQKLLDKIMQESLAPAPKLSALGFALAFCSVENLPLGVRSSFGTAILGIRDAALDLTKYKELLHDTICRFLPVMDDKVYKDILERVLRGTQAESEASFRRKISDIVLLSELIIVTKSRLECQTAIARAFSSTGVNQELEDFLSQGGQAKHYVDVKLASSICLWILSSLQHTAPENPNLAVISHSLLNKMYTLSIQQHAETSTAFQHGPNQPRRATNPFVGPQDVESGWRASLSTMLNANAEQQHHSLLELIERTCQDYEQRCLYAEQPLREERSRREAAEDKLAESQRRSAELEVTCEELESRLDQLYETKEKLASEFSEVSELATAHAAESDRWKNQYSKLEAEHALTMAEARQELEDEILQLKAQIACNTAAEHTWQPRISELEGSLQTEQEQCVQQKSQIQELQAAKAGMEAKLHDSETALALERQASSEKANALDQLRGTLAVLQSELAQAKQDSHELQQTNTTLSTNLETLEHAAQEKQQAMQTEHAQHIHELEAASNTAREEYESALLSLQRTLASAHATHQQTHAHLEQDLRATRAATLALEQQVQAKDLQLQESEKIKQQVLSLMGLQSISAQPQGSADRRHQRPSSLQPSSRLTTDRKPRPRPRRSASDLAARTLLSPVVGRDEEGCTPLPTAKFTSRSPPGSPLGSPENVREQGDQSQAQSQASSISSLSLTSPARTPLAEASPNAKLRRPVPGLQKRGASGAGPDALRRRYTVLREGGAGIASASASAGAKSRFARSTRMSERRSRGDERVGNETDPARRLPALMTQDDEEDEYACNELDEETVEL